MISMHSTATMSMFAVYCCFPNILGDTLVTLWPPWFMTKPLEYLLKAPCAGKMVIRTLYVL